MKKRDALLGALDLLVLKVVSRKPWMHGYAILGEVRLLSDDVLRVEEGSLYPALHRMKGAGWLEARWTQGQGRRKREYRLTSAGREQLAREEGRWRRITSAVDQVLEGA